MKKSLIALAVLAASGAAMAQSTVTLYGLIDTYYANVNTDNGVTSLTQNVLNAGAVNGSRWGLKGAEDLGGGLKAIFQLESGFDSTTGASGQGGLLFGRHAYVGFSGGFGTIKLGRTTTPYDDVNGAADAVFDSILAPANTVFRSVGAGSGLSTTSAAGYTIRTNNTIKYESANFSGFSGAISYALGENAAVGVSATNQTAFNLAYAGGPLSVSMAYQNETIAPAVGKSDKNFTRLNAGYDMGPAVLKASYGKAGNIANLTNADATEYQIGVDYKASSALTLSASYAKSTDNATQSALVVGGTGDVTRSGFGLGAAYTLSKRTFLYGGYATGSQSKSGLTDVKVTAIAAGVQHRF